MTILAGDFREEPWWWRDAAPSAINSAAPDDTTDIAVIGSGYAGLCCALELAQAGSSVVVIDARRIGEGASTRNAGFLSGRSGVGKQVDLPAKFGPAMANALLDEADEAYHALQEDIADNQVECGFRPVGRFVGAHTPAAYRKLESKLEGYNADGRGMYQMVPRRQQRDYVASDYWYGGMFMEDAGTIHPALYHKGLVDRCLEAGVRFMANTRALGVVNGDSEREVLIEGGVLRAREVVLAANGYTDQVSPWHQRRVIPISSTIVASENLGEDRVRELLPRLCPVIDTKRVICFARPTPDHKAILFGGRARFSPLGPVESAKILHGQLCAMFPGLADIKVNRAWAGMMAFTFDFLPKAGTHNGLHYAIGCNGGCGIVMMSWLGRHVARRILGTTNRVSAFESLPFKTQPLYSGTPWFIPIVGTWWRLRDWLEITHARRAA